MWNPPTNAELQKLPLLGHYSNTALADIKIHQHYFLGGADWWVSEFDPKDRLIYGYVNLNDQQCAEWGYSSLDELMNLSIAPDGGPLLLEVDKDLYWEPRRVVQVEGIVDCYKAQGLEKLMYKR